MSHLRHIVFVTGNYPTQAHPNRGTFVCQLVNEVARHGVHCTVIHPWKLHEWLHERNHGSSDQTETEDGVQVHRPLMVSMSNRRIGPANTFALTQASFQNAVWRVVSRLPEESDAIYGHFLYSAGAAAVWAANRLRQPGFVAVGESIAPNSRGLWSLRNVSAGAARKLFTHATGFVAVSDFLRCQLISELSIPETKIGVFPNGIDLQRFHPRDRHAMRRKYGLPQDRFLIAFVGSFDERKGVLRVCRALERFPRMGGIFVGDGPLRPSGDQVMFCGRVSHGQVPELLCAADVFVLPSREEGCSNATLEAMACGLPVVVSRRPFNADICSHENAWLVEPDDIGALREAIAVLQKNSDLRQRLGDAALSRAAHFDIRTRARGILGWMEESTRAEESLASVRVNPSTARAQEENAPDQRERTIV